MKIFKMLPYQAIILGVRKKTQGCANFRQGCAIVPLMVD